ncbi:MAG: heme-copper oxidase subunit III [Acidobacteria bacterium]|nr:heme-copper oxidase subunit III [Acidobacteriota bacterium]
MATTAKKPGLTIGNGGSHDIEDVLKTLGGGGNEGPLEPERMPPPQGYRLAMSLILTGVTMLFVTLVIVYWWLGAKKQELATPKLFWISTVVVTLCSLTLEIARRQLRRRQEQAFQLWLYVTLAFGSLFLAVQYVALRQLAAAGFFAGKNLRAWLAFFITGTHAAHLIGGLLALIYLITKSRYGDWTALRRRLSLDGTILYWHFIDVLWLFLFSMMFLWK